MIATMKGGIRLAAMALALTVAAPATAEDGAAGLAVKANQVMQDYLDLRPSAYRDRLLKLAEIRGLMQNIVSEYPNSPLAERWLNHQPVAGIEPEEIQADWLILARDREGCISNPTRECLLLEAQIAGCNIQHQMPFPYAIFEASLHAVAQDWRSYNVLIRESMEIVEEDEFHDRNNPAVFQLALAKALAGDWKQVEQYEIEVDIAMPGLFPVLYGLSHARAGSAELTKALAHDPKAAGWDYLSAKSLRPTLQALDHLENGRPALAIAAARGIDDQRVARVLTGYAHALAGQPGALRQMIGGDPQALDAIFLPLAELRGPGGSMEKAFDAARDIVMDSQKAIAFALLAGHFNDPAVNGQTARAGSGG